MPYIPKARRKSIKVPLPNDPGELNYSIFMTGLAYWETHTQNYTTLNDIIGAMELAKQEFIRRIVNPYEDRKVTQNGDIVPATEDPMRWGRVGGANDSTGS